MPTEQLRRRAAWVVVVLVAVFETTHFIMATAPATTINVMPSVGRPIEAQPVHVDIVAADDDDDEWAQMVKQTTERGHPSYLLDSQFYNFGYPLATAIGINIAAPTEPHELLVKGGAPVIIDFPMGGLSGAHSMGPFALAALHCELMNQGFPTFARSFDDGYKAEYDCPAHQVMVQQNNEWDLYRGAVVIIPEISGTSPEHTKFRLRVFKWMLGLHPSTIAHVQMDHVVAVPYNHDFKMVTRSSTNRLLASPPTNTMLRAARAYHDQNRSTPLLERRNIVLVDNDAAGVDTARLQTELRAEFPDAEVRVFQGINRPDVPLVFQQIKATVDSRLVGIEGINAEAALFDVVTIVENARVGANKLDFPTAPTAKFDRFDIMGTLVPAVARAFREYNLTKAASSAQFKAQWMRSPDLFRRHVSLWFASRSVLWRSYCRDFDECRAAMAWILSVWNAHPVGYIELFVPPTIDDFGSVNDPVWHSLRPHLLQDRLTLRQCGSAASARDEMFQTPPDDYIASTHRVVAFCEPHMLVLGADVINALVTRLMNNVTAAGRPLLIGSAPIWVAKAAPYWAAAPPVRINCTAAAVPTTTTPLDVLLYDRAAAKWQLYLTHAHTFELNMHAATANYGRVEFLVAELMAALLRSPMWASVHHLFAAPYIQLYSWPPYARYCVDVGQYDY